MEKILMVDYQGRCNVEGASVGHSSKALREYWEFLNEDFEVYAALSPCVLKAIDESLFAECYQLQYDTIAKEKKTLYDRIINKFKELYNIRQALRTMEVDIVWFYVADFYLFLYFYLFQNKKRRLVCLLCVQNFSTGSMAQIKEHIFNKALQKFHCVLYTQKNFCFSHEKAAYIPDYYYDEDIYKKYRSIKKRDKVVCVGTMGYQKKVEEAIRIFNLIDYPLEIVGWFFEKGRLHKMEEQAHSNISIQDIILSYDEYYSVLASARYAILPYDMTEYTERTSGVLQECIFVNTIPIAPNQLLESNGIPGIGYTQIEELLKIDFRAEGFDRSNIYNEIIKRDYLKSGIKKLLLEQMAEKR